MRVEYITSYTILDAISLINMNGRMYDATLGRMLSPDMFVQNAGNIQDYNRYTYANNNPLKYTDPNGWWAVQNGGATPRISPPAPGRISSNIMMGLQAIAAAERMKKDFDNIIEENRNDIDEMNSILTKKQLEELGFVSVNDINEESFKSDNFQITCLDKTSTSLKIEYQYGKLIYDDPDPITGDANVMMAVVSVSKEYEFNNNINFSGVEKSSWDGFGTVLSGFDFVAGAYSSYGHNHSTYYTTKGIEKNIYKENGLIRSARAARYAKASNLVRGVAVVGSVVSTGYSTYRVVDQYNTGGVHKIDGWDATDAGVGIIGLGATGLAYFGIISNPVGWAIGTGVLLYSGSRLAYDLYNKP